MTQSGLVIDRDRSEIAGVVLADSRQVQGGERAARNSLRTQIGRLERELLGQSSPMRFPHLPGAAGASG